MSKNARGAGVAQQHTASNALASAQIRDSTLVVLRDRFGNLTKEGGANLVVLELYRLATFLGVTYTIGGKLLSKELLLIAIKAKWTEDLDSHSGRIELAPKTAERGTLLNAR